MTRRIVLDVTKALSEYEQEWRSRISVDPSGCWLWTGYIDHRTGYPQFAAGPGRRSAHRYGYELLVGPIPEGLQLDHLCRRPACVNPEHLEPVTPAENNRRAAAVRAPRDGQRWQVVSLRSGRRLSWHWTRDAAERAAERERAWKGRRDSSCEVRPYEPA